MKSNYLTHDDLYHACRELATDRHGRFARLISDAYTLADQYNRQRLVDAFPDVFERGYHFYQASKLLEVSA